MKILIIDNLTEAGRDAKFQNVIGDSNIITIQPATFIAIENVNIAFLHTSNQVQWINALSIANVNIGFPVIPYGGGFDGIVSYANNNGQEHIQNKKMGLNDLLAILPRFLSRIAANGQIDQGDIDYLFNYDAKFENLLEHFANADPFKENQSLKAAKVELKKYTDQLLAKLTKP